MAAASRASFAIDDASANRRITLSKPLGEALVEDDEDRPRLELAGAVNETGGAKTAGCAQKHASRAA
jgi:hypothetical protein